MNGLDSLECSKGNTWCDFLTYYSILGYQNIGKDASGEDAEGSFPQS